MLSEPQGAYSIPLGTLGYFRARNRWRIYELVLNEFKKSALTQADLARRMEKRPEVVSRLLGAPGNWGLDTVSDLLFAISGAEPSYGVVYPLRESARNDTQPEWLAADNNYAWLDERRDAQSLEQQSRDREWGLGHPQEFLAQHLLDGPKHTRITDSGAAQLHQEPPQTIGSR